MRNLKTRGINYFFDELNSDKDFFTPVNDVKKIAKEIKNSKFVIIENAGHMPNMENPEALKGNFNFFGSLWINIISN
jgi:pimeloyl-ACP methyl ester carboxylesterase